jgi:hypothetical protein
MGPGIRPGRYDETIQPNDIAPTLATMLDIHSDAEWFVGPGLGGDVEPLTTYFW